VSLGDKGVKAIAGFMTDGDFNLRDLQAALNYMATNLAKHKDSMDDARRLLVESMTEDKEKRQIAYILLKAKRGRPPLTKFDKNYAAGKLLSDYRIYKFTEAPKQITDADFAEWYLYHSGLCPEADRKKMPVSETDIRMLQNRLSKARRLLDHTD
jgi:hypothetical protein